MVTEAQKKEKRARAAARAARKTAKANKLIGKAIGAAYAAAEGIPAMDTYDQAVGDKKAKSWAVIKAKGGVVGKEFGLSKNEFRWDVLVDQHKFTTGLLAVDYITEKTGVQRWIAKRVRRWM